MMKGKRTPGRKGSGNGHFVYNTRVAKAADKMGSKQEARNEGYGTRRKRLMVKKLKRASARLHHSDA